MKINAKDHLEFLSINIQSLASALQPLWHPLGFASCVINIESDDNIYRVHYWPPKERRTKNPDWPIHTHAYNLSSVILLGKVQDIQYKTTTGSEYSVYKVEYSNGNSEIIKTEESLSLIEEINKTRTTGEEYRVEKGVFHQSAVDYDESAITFVVLSEFTDNPPLVLGGSGELRYPYDRTPFNKELFWSAVAMSLPNYKS